MLGIFFLRCITQQLIITNDFEKPFTLGQSINYQLEKLYCRVTTDWRPANGTDFIRGFFGESTTLPVTALSSEIITGRISQLLYMIIIVLLLTGCSLPTSGHVRSHLRACAWTDGISLLPPAVSYSQEITHITIYLVYSPIVFPIDLHDKYFPMFDSPYFIGHMLRTSYGVWNLPNAASFVLLTGNNTSIITSNSHECMIVNGEALQLHAVFIFYYKSNKNLY